MEILRKWCWMLHIGQGWLWLEILAAKYGAEGGCIRWVNAKASS